MNKPKQKEAEKEKANDKDFGIENISKFLEKGDKDEIKEDSKFDIYRELMNEKNITYDQELYVASNRDKEMAK